MKVFVSGQIQDIAYVHEVQQKLVQAGHVITHDWTHTESGDKMLAGDADKLKDVVETGRRAQLDIDGVVNADVYVICTDNDSAGKGMYVELGAALALQSVRETPKVYLIGTKQHMSVFYFHPAVIHKQTIDEVIADLARG